MGKKTRKPLSDALAQIPDPRGKHGKRHPLQAMLMLIVVAVLGGAQSMNAVVQFGRDRGEEFAKSLGFTHGIPCGAAYHLLFLCLDRDAFESVIYAWTRQQAGDSWEAVCMDGKTLRGTQGGEGRKGKTKADVPGVHLLAAYAPQVQAVVAQMRVNAKTNEHKAALEMLDLIPVEGKVVTGDAAFCQKDLTKKIVEKKAISSSRSKTTRRV